MLQKIHSKSQNNDLDRAFKLKQRMIRTTNINVCLHNAQFLCQPLGKDRDINITNLMHFVCAFTDNARIRRITLTFSSSKEIHKKLKTSNHYKYYLWFIAKLLEWKTKGMWFFKDSFKCVRDALDDFRK